MIRQYPSRICLSAAIAATCVSAANHAAAQEVNFPTRSIRMIVPFPPGGSNDIVGRFIAQKLSERMAHQTVVDNRAGADGIIGTELAVRSPADGHTILIVSTTYTMNPAVHKLSFDPVKALAPVVQIGTGGNIIATHPSFPVKTAKELIALAKTRPGQIRYATSGIGGFNHFGGELFNMIAGVKLSHIPYKGGGPAMIDVISGQVEVLFSTQIQAMPHIRTGKLKPLGVGSPARSALMPEVPTVSESGVPGYDVSVWWGILVPAAVPAPVVNKLNAEVNAILREPEMAKRLSAEAAIATPGTPKAFADLIASELIKWGRIAKQAGIRAD